MYVKISTGTKIDFGDLRKLFSKTAFPNTGPDAKWLSDNGYANLVLTPAPVITSDQVLGDDGIELVADVWQTKWTVRAKTLEEKTADWQSLMNATDREMPRSVEDLIAAQPQAIKDNLSSFTMDRYAAKIALRATKPV